MTNIFINIIMKQWLYNIYFNYAILPLSIIFTFIIYLRNIISKKNINAYNQIPIIVVGNIFVGGTGKTPVVMCIIKRLKKIGMKPGFISRGYGTKIGNTPIIGNERINFKFFGDEPYLISINTKIPLSINFNRKKSLKSLINHHPSIDIIVSDDGLQNLKIPRDLEIIVQDTRGIGNGLIIPSGPLRDIPKKILESNFLITNLDIYKKNIKYYFKYRKFLYDNSFNFFNDLKKIKKNKKIFFNLKPVFALNRLNNKYVTLKEIADISLKKRILAIAGIGKPKRFFNMLKYFKVKLYGIKELPDHFNFNYEIIDKNIDFILVTSKDLIKFLKNDARVWEIYVDLIINYPYFVDKFINFLICNKYIYSK